MLSLSPLSSHEVAERQVWVPTKDRGRQLRRTLQSAHPLEEARDELPR